MIYPDTMRDEYDAFVTGMVTEYNRHWNKDGDSWKILKSVALYDLLNGSLCEYKDLLKNPNHLFDIANYSMFLWHNIMKEESIRYENMIQCPECGEWIDKDGMDLHLMKTRPDVVVEMLNGLREQIRIRDEKIKHHEIQRGRLITKIDELVSRLSS